MGQSITLDKPTIEKAVGQAVKHIKNWTKQELANILAQGAKSSQPLIVPLDDHAFIVGNYAIQNINNMWHMIYRYNDQELVFINRQAAIFYAILNQKRRYEQAEQILKIDQDIDRLSIELARLRVRLKNCSGKGSSRDLYIHRYQEVVLQLSNKKSLLEKSLKMAKYYNF